MEAVALAIATSDFLEKRIRGEVDRYKKFSKNPGLVDALCEIVTKLREQLRLLEGKCKQLGSKLSSEWDNGILSSRSATVSENLKSIEDRLEKESEQSKGYAKRRDILRRYSRAKSTCQMLTECRADARAVERDVVDIYNLAVQAEQVMLAQQGNSTQVEILNRMPPAAERDMFCASFDVEKNPDHVILHYGPMPCGGEEDNNATVAPEAQLKRAVLRALEADDITAAVGSLGMGGVGKSCALRGLAVDEDVRRRFPDGVYMMVLGEKASKVDVVKGVSDMVKHSGGRKLAQDMRKEGGDVKEVLSQARVWFQNRRILLLVDDVWGSGEVNSSIIGQFHRSVASGQSRLAFTTRHARLASEYQTVKFGKRDEVRSREILLKAAGVGAGSTGSFEDVVGGVLELCAGLPLALAIVGKDIAARFRYSGAQSWREAWTETLTAISSRRNRLVAKNDYDYDKHSLEAVCESSLETLEGGRDKRLGFEPELSVHEMYRSLVIQKKQAAVPVGVLRRLWGMDEECDALEAMNMFVEVSLAERRSVMLNGRDTACLSLHDLQHDFVQAKCKERGEEEQHHRKVLDGWWDGAGPSREVGGQALRDWPGSEAFEDEYMRNNVSRHLVGADLGGELRGLLWNPRWTAERLRRREVLGLEEDFGLAVASVAGEGKAEEGRGSGERERWGLEMICGAARLSASFVLRNPGEVWFQLRGRLVGLAEKSDVIREFVDEIDRYAERPWARPTWVCLSEPGGRVVSIVQCAGRVTDMRREEREGEVGVCGEVDGMGFMCSVVNGEMGREVVYVNMRAEGGCECASAGEDDGVVRSGPDRSTCRGCSGNRADESTSVEWSAAKYVRFAANGGRVVTRHVNGTTRMWDRESGEAMGGTFGGHGKRCEWSADGSLVVCGGEDGSVRIRDGASGKVVGGDERAHGGEVTCVVWSADGVLVVSGGEDGSVRIWDGVIGEGAGGDGRAHIEAVECIEWSADGSRFVSGGGDGSVRIWDGASRKVMGGDARAHGGEVLCAKWSPDAGRVVSAGFDGSVRIWDGESGEVVGGDAHAHDSWVEVIEWSPDGGRVVSGAEDGSVRIWDGASGEAVGGDERAHGAWVSCVEWSADGARVMSGGEDGSVRMWNGVSGEAVGGDERGHDRRVTCAEWSSGGGRLVTGGLDGIVKVWDADVRNGIVGDDRADGGKLKRVEWWADRDWAGPLGYESVRMLNGASHEALGADRHNHGGWVSCVEWSADGSRFVSGGRDGSVRIWDGASGEAVGGDERAHGGEVNCIQWSADRGRFLSGGVDGSVRIWNGASGEAVGGDERAHGGQVNCVEWSPDGGRVASGGEDGSVRIWDGASGEVVGGDKRAHDSLVECVKWSANGGRLVSAGEDGSVRIWDGASGEAVGGVQRIHGGWVCCVKWAADGSRVVSGAYDGSVGIWDGANGKAIGGDEHAHKGFVSRVEWSVGGSRMLSGGYDGSVRIWNGASGEAVGGDERAHGERVECAEWSADGSLVVSGGRDGSVRIWEGASGEMVGGDERAHASVVNCIEWSSDGDQFLSGGRDGSMRVWNRARREALDTEPRECETRSVKWSHSLLGKETVGLAGSMSGRNRGGDQAARTSDGDNEAGRWVGSKRALGLWRSGQRVLLGTFEADHAEMYGADRRKVVVGGVSLGFLSDGCMYRVEIVE